MYIYSITSTIYPALCIQSRLDFYSGLGGKEEAWYKLTMVALYNLSDTLGNYLVNRVSLFSQRTMWVPAVVRSAFVATFFLVAFDASPAWLF